MSRPSRAVRLCHNTPTDHSPVLSSSLLALHKIEDEKTTPYTFAFVLPYPKGSYTGALLPLLLDPATLSTSVDTTGRLRRFPSTGVARSAWTAMGMNGPNRLRNPIACEWRRKAGGGGGGIRTSTPQPKMLPLLGLCVLEFAECGIKLS